MCLVKKPLVVSNYGDAADFALEENPTTKHQEIVRRRNMTPGGTFSVLPPEGAGKPFIHIDDRDL
jgi:hypothetical protein